MSSDNSEEDARNEYIHNNDDVIKFNNDPTDNAKTKNLNTQYNKFYATSLCTKAITK